MIQSHGSINTIFSSFANWIFFQSMLWKRIPTLKKLAIFLLSQRARSCIKFSLQNLTCRLSYCCCILHSSAWCRSLPSWASFSHAIVLNVFFWVSQLQLLRLCSLCDLLKESVIWQLGLFSSDCIVHFWLLFLMLLKADFMNQMGS